MNIDNLIKEMFDLFIMVQIKGVPFALSSYRTRILEISKEILTHYRLSEGKGFERIFLDLSGFIELPEHLIQDTRRKLEDCSHAFLSGHAEDYDHYLPYNPGLSQDDFPSLQPDTHPRPIISDEVFRYVQDRLPFPLSEEEIVDIEHGFVLRWNFSEGQCIGNADMQIAVEHYLISIERVYDKMIVYKVVDLMLEYLKLIGQWKPLPLEKVTFDNKQNVVIHFSLLLADKYSEFMTSLSDCLMEKYIRYHFLPNTKDIWCRDYMPVHIKDNTFVQFIYDPDYLKKGLEHTRTDSWKVTMNLPIELRRSDLVIDGGNVTRRSNTVIMTDKIFAENPSYKTDKPRLIRKISEELEVEKVVIIPKEPWDIYGHSDGMIRFISDDTVIINDYLEEDGYSKTFIDRLKTSLQTHGLTISGTLPYRYFPKTKAEKKAQSTEQTKPTKKAEPPYPLHSADSAIGCYINYLELENLIIFPQFGIQEDAHALAKIQEYFPNKKILPLNCTPIAQKGGVLNCISWVCEIS